MLQILGWQFGLDLGKKVDDQIKINPTITAMQNAINSFPTQFDSVSRQINTLSDRTAKIEGSMDRGEMCNGNRFNVHRGFIAMASHYFSSGVLLVIEFCS